MKDYVYDIKYVNTEFYSRLFTPTRHKGLVSV